MRRRLGRAKRQVQFAGNANLVIAEARTNVRSTYFAGVTGGSGVLTGAQTQNVQFTVGRSFAPGLDDNLLSWIFATIAV